MLTFFIGALFGSGVLWFFHSSDSRDINCQPEMLVDDAGGFSQQPVSDSEHQKKLDSALSQQLERYNLPISNDIGYGGLMEKIDRLPPEFIKRQLGFLFDSKYVDGIEDPHAFSKQLVDIILDNETPGIPQDISLTFSRSPIPGIDTLPYQASIGSTDTVFAHIHSAEPVGDVMAKWVSMSSGEVLGLKKIHLGSGEDQYVWLKPSSGWKPGEVAVNLYSMKHNMASLGGGRFNISSIKKQDSEPAEDHVMNELINSGQAVPRKVPQ